MSPALAKHLEGGNYYDNMRLDIAASHRLMDEAPRRPEGRPSSWARDKARYLSDRLLTKLRLQEVLHHGGLSRQWFADFLGYWTGVLGGRPLRWPDFPCLLHEYRKKAQFVRQLEWGTPDQHVANWQHPDLLYDTLANAREVPLRSLGGSVLWPRLKSGSRVLEYGCSLAPYYHCYRRFFSHLNCRWLLADLPNFSFHYAKHLYRDDGAAEFATLYPDRLGDPLGDQADFDVIILTTVLEHLDDPLATATYLLDRLKPGGLLLFDFILSEGLGLDTPTAVEKRTACLDLLARRLKLLHGQIDPARSVSLCLGEKVA